MDAANTQEKGATETTNTQQMIAVAIRQIHPLMQASSSEVPLDLQLETKPLRH